MDSDILFSPKLQADLITMCQLRDLKLNLIYRARRDGFGKRRFLAKTVTVIRTVDDEIYVVGPVFQQAILRANSFERGHDSEFKCILYPLRGSAGGVRYPRGSYRFKTREIEIFCLG